MCQGAWHKVQLFLGSTRNMVRWNRHSQKLRKITKLWNPNSIPSRSEQKLGFRNFFSVTDFGRLATSHNISKEQKAGSYWLANRLNFRFYIGLWGSRAKILGQKCKSLKYWRFFALKKSAHQKAVLGNANRNFAPVNSRITILVNSHF